MFGSNPFGQSSSSPFGSQPVFGQNTNTNSNPFAPKPFGNTTPFGTQTGSSFFGSTATGVFGNQNSSPLGSTSVFGASTSPAFGSSTPAFGASSTSAFGSSSSPFGGTTAFGQKPAFGAFGSSSSQTSPFGSSFQQSQPAFGSSLFGSSSQSSFGAATAPAFGASSTPAFGVTNTSPFGSSGSAFGVSSSPVFGSGTPAFGAASTPAFGAASTPAFGAASTPTFGASSTPAFGSSSTGLFGASSASAPSFNFGSTPAFGQSTPTFGPSTPPFGQSTPAFGQSTPAFGQSAPAFGHSAPAFGQSTPAFGQSTPAFGSSAFGTTTPFGGQGNQFGSQASTSTFGSPGFGQSSFGTQRGGSRVTPYAQTIEADAGTQPPGKLDSISAMPTYKDKSHEELRWEDYQLGDKGGPAPANQSISVTGFGSPSTSVFGQSSANPFSSSTTSNPFAPKTLAFSSSGFGSSVSPAFTSLQSLTPSNPFGSTSSTPSLFSSPNPAFSSTAPSLFSSSSSSTTFGTSNSLFGSSLVQGSTNAFGQSPNFGNSQSSPLFQSSTPSMVPSSSPFGQSMSSFGQNMSTFGQMNAFNTQSSGFGGNLFSSTPSFGQTNTSIATPFQTAQPGQTMSAGGFGNFGQAPAGGFGGGSNMFGQGTFGQSAMIPNSVAVQPAPNNPFGTLPTMPQISFARTGTSPSIQYGISSMPVVDKSVPARVSSLLTARHLSQRRVRLPTRKYHPNVDGPKVPFFRDDEETSATPKADAFFIPRENPRALVIHPLKQLPSISHVKIIVSKHNAAQNDNTEVEVSHPPENGYTTGHKEVANGNGIKEQSQPYKQTQKAANGGMLSENNNNNNRSQTKGDSYVTLTSQRAAITFEHGADIETLMPKLRHSDYYTEPRIQELAAKERSEPGYCQHVKDFLVGRHGYGSIKFRGETDVRRLDLESLIQFNHREVIVYVDETKKPPIGQGLNKAAEVTLLNIKFFDKKTGHQYTTGPMIEKYTEMLKRKALDQGAEFVSYDPIKGEWKFRVSHFSNYKF